jgi:predicted amidophosphoribosyltransferase
MGMDIEISCDECRGRIDEKDKVYCERCLRELQDKVEELKRIICQLEQKKR